MHPRMEDMFLSTQMTEMDRWYSGTRLPMAHLCQEVYSGQNPSTLQIDPVDCDTSRRQSTACLPHSTCQIRPCIWKMVRRRHWHRLYMQRDRTSVKSARLLMLLEHGVEGADRCPRTACPSEYQRSRKEVRLHDIRSERRSSVSPLLFPIAQPSNSGHSRTSHPKDQRKVFYDVNGRITSPPEYSAYADYSDLLSQYAHSSNGARTDPGAGSPSRSALSPASSYPASSENHGTGGIPNIMDLLANYGYDPNSTNPMAYTMAGPSRTPPALLEPMPMHHQRQRRGSALEERLLPASPMGARSPGSPRSPRRKGYAMHDGGSPSPKPRGKSRFGTSDVSHYSDERETIVSGTGDLADMIRSRSGPVSQTCLFECQC